MEFPPNTRLNSIDLIDSAARAAIVEQWAKAARLYREAANASVGKRADWCTQRALWCDSKVEG
jgi:hypothetical protein